MTGRGLWILVVAVLTPAIVVPLVVPIYDRIDPTLFGFPFYFWFQFALIALSAGLTSTAFALSKVADRRDREARDGSAGGGRP